MGAAPKVFPGSSAQADAARDEVEFDLLGGAAGDRGALRRNQYSVNPGLEPGPAEPERTVHAERGRREGSDIEHRAQAD
jgi:hypothetical protein